MADSRGSITLSVCVIRFWVNCIGLFQAEYETNQLKDYSRSDVSWITSMECMLLCSILAFFGNLTFSSFLHAFHFPRGGQTVRQLWSTLAHCDRIDHVCLLASLSYKYYQFMLSQSVVSGIGSSLIFTPAMSAVSFTRRLIPTGKKQPPNHISEMSAPDLVPSEARDRWRFDSGRFIIRWRQFSADGTASAAAGGLWLDDAHLPFLILGLRSSLPISPSPPISDMDLVRSL